MAKSILFYELHWTWGGDEGAERKKKSERKNLRGNLKEPDGMIHERKSVRAEGRESQRMGQKERGLRENRGQANETTTTMTNMLASIQKKKLQMETIDRFFQFELQFYVAVFFLNRKARALNSLNAKFNWLKVCFSLRFVVVVVDSTVILNV